MVEKCVGSSKNIANFTKHSNKILWTCKSLSSLSQSLIKPFCITTKQVKWILYVTWLLCMEMAQASLSGICFLETSTPPPILNVHLIALTGTSGPHRNFTIGRPAMERKHSLSHQQSMWKTPIHRPWLVENVALQ